MCKEGCCSCPGPQGPAGVQGMQGLQGLQGVPGPAGAVGPMGPRGLTGAQGPAGPAGAQGLTGATGAVGPMGPAGPAGANGLPGAQGPQGVAGPQGVQGLQGMPGKDCDCSDREGCCTKYYATVYSLQDQTVMSLKSPKLELDVFTPAAFDVSMAPTTGELKVLLRGWYYINWGVNATLTPPFPAPVPCWSFGMYRNGVLIPSSTSGSFTSSPDDVITHCSASFIVELFPGDVLKLVNVSTNSVNVKSLPLGTLSALSAARLNIFQLTA